MSVSRLLIDTNVVLGLEDNQPLDAALGELLQLCGRHSLHVLIEAAVSDDINRDKDEKRRSITLSKLKRFERLEGITPPDESKLACKFGPINSPNDLTDCRLLYCLSLNAADLLITEDRRLRKRADRTGLGDRTLSIPDALAWIRETYEPKRIQLPHIVEKLGYAIDRTDPIFESLREGYPDFDDWFKRKCMHRSVWVVEIGGVQAGLVIYKDETHLEANTHNLGSRILKLCTFKLKPEYRGQKFGEHLLKQALWYAQANSYDLMYLTAFEDQEVLITLLCEYGFEITKKNDRGELVLEKVLVRGALSLPTGNEVLAFDRLIYPRFWDGDNVSKFVVPIRDHYHQILFPEISYEKELPLFPVRRLLLPHGNERTPGNTIRKVYLCRSPTTQIRPGDILLFYMSKSRVLAGSQCITTIGVAEQVTEAASLDELVRRTARRSVYSLEEQGELVSAAPTPVKVIDFLLVAHLDPFVSLTKLLGEGILQNAPQSITRLDTDRYRRLRPLLPV